MGQLPVLYSAHVRFSELRGGQRVYTEGRLLRKKPVESAVKRDQKSFQLCLATLFLYNRLLKEKRH